MKHLSILIFWLTLAGQAFGQGIDFSNKSWQELLLEARSEGKMIFVDAYAVWCGPCKWMDANVFKDKAVGAFYNTHFINAKIDMEKGEGPELAEKFNVGAYPTYLFVNANEEVVHVALGSMAAPEFISVGEAAINPEKQYGRLRHLYEEGNRDSDFLKRFTEAAYQAGDRIYTEVAALFLEGQENWKDNEVMAFIYTYFPMDTESAVFAFITENLNDFYKLYEEELIDRKVKSAFFRSRIDETAFDEIENKLVKIFGKEKGEKFFAEYKMSYYSRNIEENLDEYIEATKGFFRKYLREVEDWGMLNREAWNYYQLVEGKKNIKEAIRWALRSIELDNNYFNNDTLAHLYFKFGNIDAAKTYAINAIDIAKNGGMGYDDTQQLLDQLNALPR